MKRILSLILACLVLHPIAAAAVPVLVESDWTLIRSITFDNPIGAHFNPVDGHIYVACRNTDADGLYRIDGLGFAVRVAAGTYLAGVVADPATGDIFSSNSYTGVIYRSVSGVVGRQSWVTGFHTGDDDPMGMAIAPADYTGDVLLPGEALVVDGGFNGPAEVWLWSPAAAEGEVLLCADDGTLLEPVDIAIGPDSVHLVDTGPGAIYEVDTLGGLTALATSEPLAEPCGITYDPDTGDLLVLDQGAGRVVRIDPATGVVSDVLTGLLVEYGWDGVDITADGRQLMVSAYGEDTVYVFARCDATGDPEADCDANGVYDLCDIADGAPDCNGNGLPDDCDLDSGASDDCNLDGVPDDCANCPPVELVFIMDTSDSMDDEGAVLCDQMDQVVAILEATGLDVSSLLLSICDLPGEPYACLENQVDTMLGTTVPGSPPVGLETLGVCTGYMEGCQEDWALATAVVAGLYPWQPYGDSVRLIIPLADEGPYCGDPVNTLDEDATAHAIDVAREAHVIVSPITGTGSLSTVLDLAEGLADSTGGIHFNSSEPALDMAESIADLVLAACAAFTDCNENGVLDECDIADGFSEDLNGDGIPDECGVYANVLPSRIPSATPRLEQNSPNPFNPSTTIAFELPREAQVEVAVFAPDGKRVAVLAGGRFGAGRNEVSWDGRDSRGRRVASGMYFYRLDAGDYSETKRMTLLK